MSSASFSFSGELAPFLEREKRGHVFQYTCARAATLVRGSDPLRFVADRVPGKGLLLQERFTHCRGCDRVYWPGSHYERMRERLRACVQVVR